MLALVGLIAIQSWLRSDDGPIGSSVPAEPTESITGPIAPVTNSTDAVSESESETAPEPAVEDALVLADDPDSPPNTMREYLLSTPEANRNRILRLAVTGEGYECSSVKSAGLVGNSGADWRAHCGDSEVYWVVVDEFSRFSVAPIPYGDLDIPSVPIRDLAPESVSPQIQERRLEFERRLQPVEPPEAR